MRNTRGCFLNRLPIEFRLAIFVLLWGVVFLSSVSATRADENEMQRERLYRAISAGDHRLACDLLDDLVERSPNVASWWYLRGKQRFLNGEFAASIDDFDHYLGLEPERARSLWERGISCYFAQQYGAGAKQFVDYQKFHDQDVENSAWRFLCVAKEKGLPEAKETVLPVERDPRPGMIEILELYRGELTIDQVIEQVEASRLSGATAAGYQFYTFLYVGLYAEVTDRPDLAHKYLKMAADAQLHEAGQDKIHPYMAGVARQALLQLEKKNANDS